MCFHHELNAPSNKIKLDLKILVHKISLILAAAFSIVEENVLFETAILKYNYSINTELLNFYSTVFQLVQYFIVLPCESTI